MSRSPQVLGAFAKTHWRIIESHDKSLATGVRLACDPAALSAIDKCSRISWLPIEHHVALTETLFAEAGSSEAQEICRLAVLTSFEQPFMRPLFKGALAVLGRDFARFASWSPKAWTSIFRQVGNPSWTLEGENECCLRINDVEPTVLASPRYLEGLAGGFSAMFDVTGFRGDVSVSAGRERIEFWFRWET